MTENCRNCGKPVEIPSGPLMGSSLRCPYCGKMVRKSYKPQSPRKINEADLKVAILAAVRDPANQRIYANAPDGAKQYLALTYFGKCYHDDIDADEYLKAMEDLAPTLSNGDIEYLLRIETDPDMIAYFKRLLLGRQEVNPHSVDQCPVQAAPVMPVIQPSWSNTMIIAASVVLCVLIVSVTIIICSRHGDDGRANGNAESFENIVKMMQRQQLQLSDRLKEADGMSARQDAEIKRLNDKVKELEEENDELTSAREQDFRDHDKKLNARVSAYEAQIDELKALLKAAEDRVSSVKAMPSPEPTPAPVVTKPAVEQPTGPSREERGALIAQKVGEIKRLRKENPSCVVYDDPKNIRNWEIRMATGIGKYTMKKEVVYVRNVFYCTKCNCEHPGSPCDVSLKKSYPQWKIYREAADRTKTINERINTLSDEISKLQNGK